MDPEKKLSPAVEAATIRKLEAEAARLEAETAKLKEEAALAALEARDALRDEKAKLTANRFHKVYAFNGTLTDASVTLAMTQIDVWRRSEPGCSIEIIFNSPGGDVISGLAFWDYLQALRRAGHHLTTVSYGFAASMAGILLQAGDVRAIGKESWLMIHEASFGSSGKTSEVEDRVEWVKRVQDRILDIFASRSKLSKRAIRNKWARKDWWLSSDEALAAGFVDEIR